MYETIRELAEELLKLEIEEVESVRSEWIKQLRSANAGDKIIAFCDKICNLVIEEKSKAAGL